MKEKMTDEVVFPLKNIIKVWLIYIVLVSGI